MKLFSIYIKKSEANITEDLLGVKSNFSYLAFFFNIIWFLQHKMWRESLVFLLVNVLLILIFQKGFFGSFDFLIIELGLWSIIGLNAGYWYEKYLVKNNYQFAGNVFGKNEDEAKLRFISNYFKNEDQTICSSILDLKNNTNLPKYFKA